LAPLKGSTVVGKLCVSALEITESNSVTDKNQVCLRFFANCALRGPFTKATLSLYAETISLGFSNDVFLIILNKEDSFPHHQ
jgi:hypothetical protein